MVIQRIIDLSLHSLQVAEMQEDDEFSIDLEALKQEAFTC